MGNFIPVGDALPEFVKSGESLFPDRGVLVVQGGEAGIPEVLFKIEKFDLPSQEGIRGSRLMAGSCHRTDRLRPFTGDSHLDLVEFFLAEDGLVLDGFQFEIC